MAVVTKEYNGSGPTASTITHLKHRAADTYVNDATNPIPKPTTTGYGWWKTIALYADNGADIYSDIKIYGGGAPSPACRNESSSSSHGTPKSPSSACSMLTSPKAAFTRKALMRSSGIITSP